MANSSFKLEEATLRKRIGTFLGSKSRLKSPLICALKRLSEHGLPAVLFGGTLRDLMVFGASTEPRDVDVVVDCGSVEELAAIFPEYILRKTRFGGLHLNVRGWAVDVWPLSQTWALRELNIEGGDFNALTKTTFLNVEAVTAELAPKSGARRDVLSSGFFEALFSRTLDINLEENPFPELCAVRALVTASALHYGITKKLARYVLHYLQRTTVEELVEIQIKHYGWVRCDVHSLRTWRNAIQSQIGTSDRLTPPVVRPVQLPLLPAILADETAVRAATPLLRQDLVR